MSQFVLLCRHSFSLARNYSSSTNEEINTLDLSKGKCDFSRGDTICKVLQIYENFPTNFTRVIDQFFSRSKKSKDKYDFEKLFLDPIFDPILEVYHNFLTTRSSKRTGYARPSLSYLNRDRFQYIPRALAVDILGVKQGDLESLIRLGILKEYEIKCQNFLNRDQVFALFNQCKGDIRSTYRRISIREVLNKYARKGITFTCLVLLIINRVLCSGCSVLCISLMDVTFDEEELKVCLERIIKKEYKKGRVNMQRDNNDVLFGLATVTGQGILFNDRVYSNTQMIKHQWFELAQKTGSWTIPILFNPAESEHVFILDMGGLEVASSLEKGPEVEPVILESYYQALNVLKEQIRLKKRD